MRLSFGFSDVAIQRLKAIYPEFLELLGLGVQVLSYLHDLKQRLFPNGLQQLLGKLAHWVPSKIPVVQNTCWDYGFATPVATVAKVLAQVVTVPQPLHVP